jgi:hypothetical protein
MMIGCTALPVVQQMATAVAARGTEQLQLNVVCPSFGMLSAA